MGIKVKISYNFALIKGILVFKENNLIGFKLFMNL